MLFERDDPPVEVVDWQSGELGGVERAAWLGAVLGAHGVQMDSPRRSRVKAFINYRKGECGEAAFLLHNQLALRWGDQKVFRDNRSIPPGQVFPGELIDKVRTCRALLVLFGLGWEDHRERAVARSMIPRTGSGGRSRKRRPRAPRSFRCSWAPVGSSPTGICPTHWRTWLSGKLCTFRTGSGRRK